MSRKARPGSPGTKTADEVAAMIRVDHAGEYGAVRIYEGQLAVLGARRSQTADAIRHMAEQEQVHLKPSTR
jgi:ubiquinone biosynthesis monooxygenase Coq7